MEDTGLLLVIDLVPDSGGICKGNAIGTFSQSLSNVIDVEGYTGVVIAKRCSTVPTTDEPIVYGFSSLLQQRNVLSSSAVVLGLSREKDRFQHENNLVKHENKSDDQLLKSIQTHSRAAIRAWKALKKGTSDTLDYNSFKDALDTLDIKIMESRAKWLWSVMDLGNRGLIDISDFEIGLMAHDAIEIKEYLTPYDSFHAFDLDKGGSISFEEFARAIEVLTDRSWTENSAYAIFKKLPKTLNGELDYLAYKQAWYNLVNSSEELKKRGINAHSTTHIFTTKKSVLKSAVELEEKIEKETWGNIRRRIEDVRQKVRKKRDQKKRKTVIKNHMGLSDAKEAVERRRTKQIMIQKEQKQNIRQRDEARVLANRLEVAKAEQKRQESQKIKAKFAAKEADRQEAIKASGKDQIWITGNPRMKLLPDEMWKEDDWIQRLPFVVLCDLSENSLEELPTGENFFGRMKHLRKLSLSNNVLDDLTSLALDKCHNLQILNIDRNHLHEIPNIFNSLPQIQRLDISSNRLSALPHSIGSLSHLQTLIAHSNTLQAIPETIGELKSLEIFDISANALKEIPESISKCLSLRLMNVSRNRLARLPVDLGNLMELTAVWAGFNRLTAIPDSMVSLIKLEHLDLQYNCLPELGHALDGMTNCLDINVSRNCIEVLSFKIRGCESLQVLDLRGNCLHAVPVELGLCNNLLSLHVSGNQLGCIPDEIEGCTILSLLDLSSNCIKGDLTEHLGNLAQLISLNVSYNLITTFPSSIGALANLQTLKASHNRLEKLPDSLKFLHHLRVVDFSSNCLKEMPPVFFGMMDLEELDLTSNLISNLNTEGLLATKKLKRLVLSGNRIKLLPLEISKLVEAIPDFKFDNNPLNLPQKWLPYQESEVLEYMNAQAIFRPIAMRHWTKKFNLYLDHKASLMDFENTIIDDLKHAGTWRPFLLPHIRTFFVECKERGGNGGEDSSLLFPMAEALEDDEEE